MRRALPVVLVWLAIAGSVPAQEPSPSAGAEGLKKLSLQQLSQVEITSVNKEPAQAFQTPAAINVITSTDIRRSGAQTIPDVLRLIPGVDVAQIDSNEWAIGVRGFEGKLSKSVLVLIDGRSVYTPLFAGVYWDMQDVMIEDIDRIEVIRGPGGTIWGSNAVNGVINIITKKAQDTRGTLVSAGGGNVDQGFLNWRYGAGTDAFSYRIYGKGFTRAPEEHSDGQNFDDWRRGQVGFRADWAAGKRDNLTFQGDAYGGEAGELLQLNSYSPPANPAVAGNKLFNGENVMATWRRLFAGGSDLQLRTYYDRTDREELNFHEVRNTFDADFIHHVPKGRHDITWGLGVRVSPSQFTQTVPTVDFMPHDQTYNIFSAFVQDEIALVRDRLSLTVGSKFEHTTFSGFDYQPGIRLAWTPNQQNTLWAAVTRAARTASRIEDGFNYTALLQANPPFYLRLVGDGGFTQEQLVGYELGYRRYLSQKGFISLSLFHNRYDDLLSIEPQPVEVESTPEPAHAVLPLLLRNGIAANSSGGELASLWDVRNWWRVRASYSLVLLDAKRQPGSSDPSTVRQLEGDTPQHKVVVQSYFTLPKGFEFDAAYRFVSAVADPGAAIPAYSTGDARLARQMGDHLLLEVVGQNLMQPWHEEYAGPPGPVVGIQRSGFLRLTWTP
jgi:iron complex outermembrane recepter protein